MFSPIMHGWLLKKENWPRKALKKALKKRKFAKKSTRFHSFCGSIPKGDRGNLYIPSVCPYVHPPRPPEAGPGLSEAGPDLSEAGPGLSEADSDLSKADSDLSEADSDLSEADSDLLEAD